MHICNCGKEFIKKNGYSSHLRHCNGFGTKVDLPKIKEIWTCPLCNYPILNNKKKHLEFCGGLGPRRQRIKLSRSEASKLNWKNETYRNNVIDKIKSAIRDIPNFGQCKDKSKEKIRRNKLRNLINERYSKGWMPRAGRTKKIEYNSDIAGKVLLDGNWELSVAKYFDKIKVKWLRNKKRFKYINLKGNESFYTPDFWVEDWNTFIEIKGHETDLDRCKWSQFSENIEIWKKDKLKNLKII